MKSKQWREDREWLRRQLRLRLSRQDNMQPAAATLLCVLVSHMRGKQHMKTYCLKDCGWRSMTAAVKIKDGVTVPDTQKKLVRGLYGDYADAYYAKAVIRDLDDQLAFIEYMNGWANLSDELQGIVDRVLAGYPEEEELRKTA